MDLITPPSTVRVMFLCCLDVRVIVLIDLNLRLPFPTLATGHAAVYLVPDSTAVFGVFSSKGFDDLTVTVIREDGDDPFVLEYYISLEPGSETEGAVIVPDWFWWGAVYTYHEFQVGQFIVDVLGDVQFPGHAPEHCVWAVISQTDYVIQVAGEEISGGGESNRRLLPGFFNESGDIFARQVLGYPGLFSFAVGPSGGAALGVTGFAAVLGWGAMAGDG
jgi:hypothetical protein